MEVGSRSQNLTSNITFATLGMHFDAGCLIYPPPPVMSISELSCCCLQIYLANMTWWTTDVEVETLCSEFGKVCSVLDLAKVQSERGAGETDMQENCAA